MLTQNAYNGFLMQSFGLPKTLEASDGNIMEGIRGGEPAHFLDFAYMTYTRTNKDYEGVAFGDGAEEPKLSDTKLKGKYLSTISVNAGAHTVTEENGKVIHECIYNITNSGTSDITIREICYSERHYDSVKWNRTSMLDRTLLDEPLTIPPGEIGRITYRIELDISSILAGIPTDASEATGVVESAE